MTNAVTRASMSHSSANALEHYKYTGKFRQSRGVINALRLLQKDAPFTIEQDEDKQIIYIK